MRILMVEDDLDLCHVLNIHLKNGVAKAQIKDIEGKNYAKRL